MDHSSEMTEVGTATVEIATFKANGGTYTALGAVLDPASGRISGYVSQDGRMLTTWSGTPIAALRVTGHATGFPDATGRRSRLTCYSATLDGKTYHGRNAGPCMFLKMRHGR